MAESHSFWLDREDFYEFLNLPPGTAIERIEMSFSPAMGQWHVLVELAPALAGEAGRAN